MCMFNFCSIISAVIIPGIEGNLPNTDTEERDRHSRASIVWLTRFTSDTRREVR
jgi:hypothetical protein